MPFEWSFTERFDIFHFSCPLSWQCELCLHKRAVVAWLCYQLTMVGGLVDQLVGLWIINIVERLVDK